MTIQRESVAGRFLRYVQVPTASDEKSSTVPTTGCQFDLARMLVEELRGMGITDARVDEKCYVYASIPASEGCERCPSIGFIAHMDTVSDFAREQVKPLIHEEYDGKDLFLGDSGRTLETRVFKGLADLKGRTLITSDGTTILGADDKAGVAEIMTLAQRLMEGGTAHGRICIGFTPDEETGAGADYFDVDGFGADFAYTVDGGAEGEIEYENFNAAGATFEINGFNVHPGSAKDTMVNAALAAMEINQMLPKSETPRDTQGYEGFYHLLEMEGNVEKASLSYIVRDHDEAKYEEKLQRLHEIADALNQKYGEDTVCLKIKEQYRNMAEKIKPCFHLIENARKAAKAAGVEPVTNPIRGGTDGARLSFMGLPCPNLGTGGYAFHGPYEHITVQGMEKVVEILMGIVRAYAEVEKDGIL